jgi:hypothetical protein
VPALLARRLALTARERLLRLAVLASALVVVTAPWVVRNVVAFEHPVFVSTNGGVTLGLASCDETFHGDLIGWWSAGCIEDPLPRPVEDESEFELRLREHAMDYLNAHKTRLPTVIAARVGRLWGLYRPEQTISLNGHFELQSVVLTRIIWWVTWPSLALAAAGAVILHRRQKPVWPVLVLYVVSTVAVAAAFAIIRYRVAAEVATPILCGIAIDALWIRLRHRAPEQKSSDPLVERGSTAP